MPQFASSPICPNCGYCLRGLHDPRCPECGQPFDPDDPALVSPRHGSGLLLLGMALGGSGVALLAHLKCTYWLMWVAVYCGLDAVSWAFWSAVALGLAYFGVTAYRSGQLLCSPSKRRRDRIGATLAVIVSALALAALVTLAFIEWSST